MSEIELNLKIAHFLDGLPSGLTLSNIQDRLVCVFSTRAWSRTDIQKYLGIADQETGGSRRCVVNSDEELKSFFSENRSRYTIDEMLAAAALHFPGRKLPSRSSLHRFLSKTRK